MVRDTSLRANEFLKARGKDKERYEQILGILKKGIYPDYSSKEIAAIMGVEVNCVSGRCTELKKRGDIEEAPERKCRVTGFTCHPVRIKPKQLDLLEAA